MGRRLTIVFFDAGGGHRSAAEALKSVLETHRWQVHLLNLQEQLDQLDLLKKVTGLRIQAVSYTHLTLPTICSV